jgi:outer membrane immunogenic protein
MNRLSVAGLVTTAVLGSAAGVRAADLPAAPPAYKAPGPVVVPLNTWTGFYVGAQVGYGFGQSSGTQNANGTFFPVVPYSIDPAGVLGGGHVGFNYQTAALVVGAEADVEASNLNGATTIFAFDQTYVFNVKADTLASVRGRIGWAQDRLMLYGTGGVAWGHVSTPPLDALNGWRTGWTAGAGAEYALPRNWSAKVEYRYTDLGRVSSFDPNLNSIDDNKLSFHAVRLGVSRKLGTP